MKSHIVYLHGFLSSPQSEKAQATRAFVQTHYPTHTLHIPQLPNYPDQARDFLMEWVPSLEGQRLGFIGSSMGGFLCTWLGHHFSGKAVLINPAVSPHRLMNGMLGQHQNPYTKETFELTPRHVDVLEAMHITGAARPHQTWALLQTGDETLNYRDAEALYQDCRLTVEAGGDHSFIGYEKHLPQILEFLTNKEK